MKTVTNTCDFCKEVIPEDDQIWYLGLYCSHKQFTHHTALTKTLQQEACRACTEKFRLIPFAQKKSEEPPMPTDAEKLEAVIYDIVGNAVADQLRDQQRT